MSDAIWTLWTMDYMVMLIEVGLIGQGRLDLAVFTSAVMEVTEEVEEIMDDAERMFEAPEPKHDEEGAVSVEDIVDGIIGGELEVADYARNMFGVEWQ